MKFIIHSIYLLTWMPFYLIIELSRSIDIKTHGGDEEIELGIGAGAALAGFMLFGILFLGFVISLFLSLIYILYKRSKDSLYTLVPLVLAIPFFIDQIFPLSYEASESLGDRTQQILWQTMLSSLVPFYYLQSLIVRIRKRFVVETSDKNL